MPKKIMAQLLKAGTIVKVTNPAYGTLLGRCGVIIDGGTSLRNNYLIKFEEPNEFCWGKNEDMLYLTRGVEFQICRSFIAKKFL